MTRKNRFSVFGFRFPAFGNRKSRTGQAVWVCFLLCALLSAGCQTGNRAARDEAQTRQMLDDLGRVVTIPARVERVVSLAPNLTENIFAVGAGDRLVGVTSFCNYPEAARLVPKVGDTINPNMEAIVALKPQIVFVSTASQIEAFTKTLEEQRIAVFVTNPQNLEGVLTNLRQLGDIFGTTERATVLLNELQEKILGVEETTRDRPKVKTFVQISKEPLFTIGRESFLTDLVARAGGESVTKDVATAFPKLNKETALALDPDVIILSDSEDNREPNDVFANSKAVKNGKVFRIDADILSRPGPRLVDALERIAEDLQK